MHVAADEYAKYPGASHCDELPYLFKTGKETKISPPTLDSKEFDMIQKMTETFTTFASLGDPNNHEIHEHWEDIQSKETPFRCMNINQDETKMMQLPESERLKTWNEIFEQENVDLH